MWVHATLVDSTIVAADAWLEPTDRERRARFYDETKPIGRAFGIPESLLPADLDAFEAYLDGMLGPGGAVKVGPLARELARRSSSATPRRPRGAPDPGHCLRLDDVARRGAAPARGPRCVRVRLGHAPSARLGLAGCRLARLEPAPAGLVPADAAGPRRGPAHRGLTFRPDPISPTRWVNRRSSGPAPPGSGRGRRPDRSFTHPAGQREVERPGTAWIGPRTSSRPLVHPPGGSTEVEIDAPEVAVRRASAAPPSARTRTIANDGRWDAVDVDARGRRLPGDGLEQLVRPTVAAGGPGRRDHARVASGIGPAWAMVGRPWVPARQGRSLARPRPLAVDRRDVGPRSGMERGAGGLVLLDPLDPGSLSAVRLDQPGRLRVFTGVPPGHRAAPGTQLDRVRGRLDGTAPRCRDLSDGPSTPLAGRAGRRGGAVRRQHLALPGRGHRARLPLAGDLGIRHPHEGHARHRAAVVRRAA